MNLDAAAHARDLVAVLRWLTRLDAADLLAGALDLPTVRASAVRLFDAAILMAPSEVANLSRGAVRDRLAPRPLQAQCTPRDVQAAVLIRRRLELGLIQGSTEPKDTRDSVARRAGVTQSLVSRCELGRAPLARMIEVAEALGVPDLVARAVVLGAELRAAGVALVDTPDRLARLSPAQLATLTPFAAPAAPAAP
jgi:transcriptional regulator with XRE-family HTH domain